MPARPKGKSRRRAIPVGNLPFVATPTPPTDIQLAHQTLVGRLVMAWSSLEASMQGLIWAFLNLSLSDGRILTSRLDASSIIPILQALGRRHLTEDRLQGFLDELSTINGYREGRNFIVHGLWYIIGVGDIPAVMS